MGALTDYQADDLMDMICGQLLGQGEHRKVFACRFNDSQVIKFDNLRNFSNATEWAIWNELKDTPIGKWLAPVYSISDGGMWLAMARTEPLRDKELPKKVPSMFCDIKRSNWGLFEGRPVCHDYGNNRTLTIAGKHGSRLVKTSWERS